MSVTVTDIFAGAGGSSTGAAQVPGVHVAIAANHWQLAVDVHHQNHPDTRHACVDLHMEDPRNFPRTDVLWASPECFAAGTLILTDRGLVPIENVHVGDQVLTHTGRYRPVTHTMNRQATTVHLHGTDHRSGLETTLEHPIWARTGPHAPQWTPAGDLPVDGTTCWATPVAHPGAQVPGGVNGLPVTDTRFAFRVGVWITTGADSHMDAIRAGIDTPRFHEWLHTHLGEVGAPLPAWMLGTPNEWRNALLHGITYASPAGDRWFRHQSKQIVLFTHLLAASLGHRTRLHHNTHHHRWELHWAAPDQQNTASGQRWHPVVRRRPGRTRTTVYDLTVADDHSYIADGIIVHNCTKWSIANSKAKALSLDMGGDPTLFDDIPTNLETNDEDDISRSRLLMFDVLRFIEHHRYRAVVVENVVDIATQAKYAAAWTAWRRGLDRLGYAFRVVSFNSMHAQHAGDPAPQSRDRLYVVAWPKNERPVDVDQVMRPQGWCGRCDRMVATRQAWKPGRSVGRYRAQYLYACPDCGDVVEPGWLPAAAAIDWTLPAERIGDRDRPLSEKTMDRIREGLRRYGTGQAMVQRHRNIAAGMGHVVTPVTEPVRTLTASGSQSLLQPEGVVVDAIRSAPILSHTGEPFHTQTPACTRGLLIPTEGRDGKHATSVDRVLRTQTCRNETGLLVPYYSTSDTAKPVSYPVGTLTTVDRYALVTLRGVNAPKPAGGVMDTVAASGNHHGLLDVSEEDVMNCRFRMLEPHEIAAGMAFPLDYQWQGTKRDRVRMAGNAVTPPAARDLMSAVAASILGEDR